MSELAILGHPTRGSEVIKILEMLGGNNQNNVYSGKDTFHYYFIDNETGYIKTKLYTDDCWTKLTYNIFTLEEFLEKFPYKVGDKVIYEDKVREVTKMVWEEQTNTVAYKLDDKLYCNVIKELQLYKEGTMESNPILQQLKEYFDNTPRDVIEKEWEELSHLNEIGPTVNEYLASVRKYRQANQYPKTCEECCKVLGYNQMMPKDHILGYRGTLLSIFQLLLICRDAYWKIAGYWKPDWKDENETYYTISYDGVNIKCYNNTDVYSKLAFPTKEMRYAFYENFKELIEQCKELL